MSYGPTMARSCPPSWSSSFLLPSLLSLLLFLLSDFCVPYPTSASLYTDFLQCLTNYTRQSAEQISGILYANANSSSFTTLLDSRVRNRRFNTSSTPKPHLIVTPAGDPYVQASVLCSKAAGIQLRTRSGGHDFEGASYVSDEPFVLLDMFNFRDIEVNVVEETAWVGAGTTLGELYYRVWEKSGLYGFPAGVCPTVGVGGHLSGGGYGNMLRKFGLSSDNIIDAKIVDANGRVLDRTLMGEDLFWAIRGGGGASFGVILSYKVKLVPVPEVVTVFRVERMIEEGATELVYRWQYVAPSTDNNLFMRLLLQPVSSKVKLGATTVRASVFTLFLGNTEKLVAMLNGEFPELGLRKEDCMEMSWINSALWWGNFDIGTAPEALLNRTPESVSFLKRKSDYVEKPIGKDGLELLWEKMIELGKVGLVFNPYGGRMAEIPASESPFPHRAGNLYKIQYSVSWSEEGSEAEKNCLAQIRELYSFMTPFVSKNPRKAFINYRDLDIGTTANGANSYQEGSVYGVKYFGGNFQRLMKVKTAVDPQNFFRNEQSIPVLPRSSSNSGSTKKHRKLIMAVIFLLALEVIS